MPQDPVRIDTVTRALRQANLDAVVCALPAHVLLVTGYWPVVGASIAVATREGAVAILVPEDELELLGRGGADMVHTFKPSSLADLHTTVGAAFEGLHAMTRALGLYGGRIGYEGGAVSEPASYAEMYFYNVDMFKLVGQAFGRASVVPANELLRQLRAVKTPIELERIRTACRIAAMAYAEGARRSQPGLKETELAALFRTPLSVEGVGLEGVERADGFVFCRSGPNAANAKAAYQRSTSRRLRAKEPMVIHCNSFADGYWTDITRTFCFGGLDERWTRVFKAVLEARDAGLEGVRPGARGADVDRVVRAVLEAHGLGNTFTHSTGHGVGFLATDPHAWPRLHPKSHDVLEPGMVFNLEPGVYLEGIGGVRQCEMVAVTSDGAELLTPFQGSAPELSIP